MKYVIGYSGGKDCTFTIEKLNEEGHQLVGIAMFRTKGGFSYNHALSEDLAKQYADVLGVPLYFVESNSVFDRKAIYDWVCKMKEDGVEAVAYGETQNFYKEMKEMCDKIVLKLLAPLFDFKDETIVDIVLKRNYKMIIVNASKKIPCAKEIIGKYLDQKMVDQLKAAGCDVSGNDGSYHSQVIDCPLFNKPLEITEPKIAETDDRYFALLEDINIEN